MAKQRLVLRKSSECAFFSTATSTSGGSSESEATALAVKPCAGLAPRRHDCHSGGEMPHDLALLCRIECHVRIHPSVDFLSCERPWPVVVNLALYRISHDDEWVAIRLTRRRRFAFDFCISDPRSKKQAAATSPKISGAKSREARHGQDRQEHGRRLEVVKARQDPGLDHEEHPVGDRDHGSKRSTGRPSSHSTRKIRLMATIPDPQTWASCRSTKLIGPPWRRMAQKSAPSHRALR